MTKRRRVPQAIETTGSVFSDLFEHAEAERLSIQSGLALALERAIAAQQWTQAEAAWRLGITQPRVNDLLRGRLVPRLHSEINHSGAPFCGSAWARQGSARGSDQIRTAHRGALFPDVQDSGTGFRVVMSPFSSDLGAH